MPESYATRRHAVLVGKTRSEVLVAAFPLASGGEVLFQLADEGDLKRGGVYVLLPGDEAARAPRFDELFRDVAAKARNAALAGALLALVERAQKVARATRPQLTPKALTALVRLGRSGARLDARHEVPGLPAEALILSLALVFTSEEERYPRPRFRGSDVAVERILELLRGSATKPSRE